MCCFSKPVRAVSKTNILAVGYVDGRQWTTYSMRVRADEELAMVLPLPVAPATIDIEFVSMEAFPRFFDDLAGLFPVPKPVVTGIEIWGGRPTLRSARLPVVEVGDFEASFVPCLRDFDRLDPRFVVPTEVWAQRPEYEDYGFAVFRIDPRLHANASIRRFHPMSFIFPRRDRDTLFFPTVHVHDGVMRNLARFDHELYAQVESDTLEGWTRSKTIVDFTSLPRKLRARFDSSKHLFKKSLHGRLPNEDTLVSNPMGVTGAS